MSLYIPTDSAQGLQCVYIVTNTCSVFSSILAFLLGVKCYLVNGLIFIPLRTSGVEYLFTSFRPAYYKVRSIKSFAHFFH